MEKIELRTAFAWDCPSCGARDNFATCVTAELTDSEAKELRSIMRLGEGEEWKQQTPGEFVEEVGLVTQPESVKCPKCGDSFATVDHGERMPPGFDPHKDLA